ncbi:hypothetical protein [Clostridium butyricum]|nr:hypothetical protein [Clostridium butyricum]
MDIYKGQEKDTFIINLIKKSGTEREDTETDEEDSSECDEESH